MLRGRFFSRFRRQLSERIPALLPTLYPVTDNDSAHSAHSVSWNSLPPVYTVCLVLPGCLTLPERQKPWAREGVRVYLNQYRVPFINTVPCAKRPTGAPPTRCRRASGDRFGHSSDLFCPSARLPQTVARASEALGKRGSACISESISCNMYAMLEAKRSSSHAMSAQSSVY